MLFSCAEKNKRKQTSGDDFMVLFLNIIQKETGLNVALGIKFHQLFQREQGYLCPTFLNFITVAVSPKSVM